MLHKVKLTDSQKIQWFVDRIEERKSTKSFESKDELVQFIRVIRESFKSIYNRDVPGSFISRLMNSLGFDREYSESTKKKKEWMFKVMDENASLRENKSQLRKALENEFQEKILGIVFDELWDEYHSMSDHPKAKVDVDIFGQSSLFGD